MHFSIKNTLKSNRNHTPNKPVPDISFLAGTLSCQYVCSKKKKNQKGLGFIVSLYRGTQFIMDKTLKLSLNSYKKKLNKLGLRGRIVYIYIGLHLSSSN